MKIAILISGQPRFMQQGSQWIQDRLFPKKYGYDIDFFVHAWDDFDPELENKIVNYYNPISYKIDNYQQYIDDFKTQVIKKNNSLNDNDILNILPLKIRDNILFDTPVPTTYGENFWGQFLSTYEVSKMVTDYQDYDIVIKTRSDAIMDTMNPQILYRALSNIIKNPAFSNKIFTPWLHAFRGIPYFCDFAFISTPTTWKKYSENLREKCLNLATDDKALFYEFKIHDFDGISHWTWNKLSIYSITGFLSFSVTWPMKFDGVSLIRENIDISNMSYHQINQHFLSHQ